MMNVIIGMFCIVSKILLYFKNLLKKKLTFLLLGYYLQQEMGTNISLWPHKKGSQGYPKMEFQ